MSSNLYSDIYVLNNGNIIGKENLVTNYMKSVLHLGDVDEHLKEILPVEDTSFEVIGYISPNHLDQIDDSMVVTKNKNYILVKSYFDSYKLRQNKVIFSDKKDGDLEARREVYYSSSVWTNVSNLSDYIEYKRSEVVEKYSKLSKLNEIKDSVEFYKLNEKAKDDLNDDINYLEDYISDINNEIDSCNRLIGSVDSVYDRLNNDYNNTIAIRMYLY